MSFVYLFAIAFFLFLCLVLTGVILVQESKSSGLGASFGGDAGQSLFGVAAPQILKSFTAWLAALFMLLCVLLSFWTSLRGREPLSASTVVEDVESSAP